MISFNAKILSNEAQGCDIYKLSLSVDKLPKIQCGQFVMVSCGSSDGILLKRPISIHDFDGDTVTLLYETIGKGTLALSKMTAGEFVDIILPLGKGFDLKDYKRVALVGGGLGIFPLYSVIKLHPEIDYYAYLGARDTARFVCADSFQEKCACVKLATDDGSVGRKAFITDILKEDLDKTAFDAIFACGPKPMLKALKNVTKDTQIPVFVSMEEHMGCGFGVCLTCTCATVRGNKRVCADGPVFPLDEVIL